MTRHAQIAAVMLAFATGASATDPPGAAVKLSTVSPTTSNLRVHFIDVGHGLGMLIETPGG